MNAAIEAAAERAMRAFELHHARVVREWSTLPEFVRQPWRAVARAVLEHEARAELLAPRATVHEAEFELDDEHREDG